MGVKGLWTLLKPCGRQVSVETVRGKTLAIDASIWLVQFLKGMRDRDGGMVPNAHVLGVLHRVLKLLFHGVRPIFVFDGGAPVLKKRTLLRRQQRRDTQASKMKRTAHKLLARELQRRRERGRRRGGERRVREERRRGRRRERWRRRQRR
jgi:DNA excision repair protein ERCC-5